MIPLKLQIKNFVSYGATQEIDFEPYNLICLSGKNGHGKSAMLDALTWVLWGQGRKVGGAAKPEEGLMRLGQTHMMVSLDFMSNNISYRVRREYAITGNKNQTNLEFGILDPATNSIKALTDKTIRATQAKIESLVGLDYESFINSAFLRQGQANEFSKKTPKERKEILATILGLDRFEQIRRLALDRVKEANNQRDLSVAALDRLKHELSQKPIVQEKLLLIDQSLVTFVKNEESLNSTLQEIKVKSQALAAQKAQAEKIEFQKQHLEKSLEEHKKQIIEETSSWRRVARQQRTQGNYGQLDKERTLLQTELQQLQFHAAKKIQLKEEFLAKKEALRQYVQQIHDSFKAEHEKIAIQDQTNDLKIKTTKEKVQELDKKRVQLGKELSVITAEELSLKAQPVAPTNEAIAAAEKNLERRKGYYHSFTSRANALSAHLASLDQKKQLVAHAEQAQCPLCEQDADKDELRIKFELQQRLYAHQLTRLTQVLRILKTSLITQHESVELLKKGAEQARITQIKLIELAKQKAKLSFESEQVQQELSTLTGALLNLHTDKENTAKFLAEIAQRAEKIQEDPPFKTMQSALAQVTEMLEKIPYNPEREKVVHQKLTFLSAQLEQQATFLKEVAQQEERKRSVHTKCQYARELKEQITFLGSTAVELGSYKSQEATLTAQEQQISLQLQALTKEKELLIHQKGALEAQCLNLTQREHEYKLEEKACAGFTQQVQEYTAIAGAVGKDGIQALLIEDALPEIEQAANDLLARLTDNQAHLSFESLRDLRSGKTKETLDIKISDAVGVRPYELYSGGEAFRIDFAIRIAISKLLARRAGTALQTLIIDEGFGSQDDEGLANIMEALYMIQEDFEKIIIVSHLPSMKEQFPVHFLITKTSEGSSVQVIEHC